jgi:endonuclease/exonuclease/phosphatase family metal-dependent hydrolase
MKSKKTKAAGKISLFLRIVFLFNLVFIFSIILSYLAPYISPDRFWPLAFFGMAYPAFFLINFLFLFFWLIFKRKFAVIVTVVLLVGINNLFKLVQSNKRYDVKDLKDAFKVVSFNTKDFGIYNYKKNWQFDYTNRNKIFEFLKREQPAIICLQEYVSDVTGDFKTGDTLKEFLDAKNQHIAYTVNSRNMNYFGIATFTKYPILDTGRIVFNTISGNICIYTDVRINSDTVRIYNAHFESIRMKPEDYVFAEQVSKEIKKNIGIRRNSKRILARLKSAFIIRAPQARLVAEHIKNCPYPVILCSDFNDTPISYSYHEVSSMLEDSFIESGNGIGQTYAGVFPSFRIDYILHSKEFRSYNFETVEEEMSDHFPVKCYLKFEKEKGK